MQRFLLVIILMLGLVGCDSGDDEPANQVLQPVTNVRELQIVTGQTVYVPAYSEIFHTNASQTVKLTVTLAIHNSDPNSPIIIESVEYFDTNGKLVKNYVENPQQVPPLATAGFVVEQSDTSGGWGANFLVKWGAEQPVYEPVIEAVMISTSSAIGISMISPGRVVSQSN